MAAIEPEAPALLSMMIVVPKLCAILSVTIRATISAPPPGATGTITLITRFGNVDCASEINGSAPSDKLAMAMP